MTAETRRFFFQQLGAGAVGRAGLLSFTGALRPVPHSLLTDDPGKMHLDLWGWHTSSFYQRSDGRVVSPDYLRKRAVEESYKWGANLVEIYRGGFPLEQRTGWNKESTAALNRRIHELDMLVQWFPHRLDETGVSAADATQHWATNSDTPTNTFPGAIAAMRALGRDQFDALEVPAENLLDGMGTEQWPVMHALLFNLCMWPFNPAMFFYTDNHAFDETLPNEIDVSGSNGSGTDDQTSGYYKLPSEIRKRYGFQFWGSQAECRSGITKNRFGGLGQPDWIAKQVNDQFRERARVRGRRNLSPSALWWINEVEEICPDENRRYVYGVSQDPVRCAVTARLSALGEGGRKVETEAGIRGLPQRFPYPSRTAFIQNNYLCVFAFDGRDDTMLWHDPERLAHFDNDSPAVQLCGSLAKTVMAEGEGVPEVKSVGFEHVEPAGYKAVLRARLLLDVGGNPVEETRTYVVANAIRLMPRLMGSAPDRMRTLHIGHHLDAACEDLGLEATAPGHDVFRGMHPSSSAGVYSLIAPTGVDVFKRVLWDAPNGIAVLARMRTAFKPGKNWDDPIFAASPVLWEQKLGQGTILASGFGLRYALGSPNRWTPSDNARLLVANAVRYLSRGSGTARVALL